MALYQIAQRTGVEWPTLYTHFRDVDGVVTAWRQGGPRSPPPWLNAPYARPRC
jgi:hypothetical protein